MYPSDAQSAVDAIYSHLDGSSVYANSHWLINAMMSDNGFANNLDPDLHQLSEFTIDAHNSVVIDIWTQLYAAINTANFAIENIPVVPLSDPEKNLLIAEARFFRAMFYFDLARYFGDLPLMTKPITDLNQEFRLERSPVDSVYELIVSDLEFAQTNLTEFSNYGRPSQLVASALLSKVFTEMKEYSKAFSLSRGVILSEEYSLLDDYGEVFKISNNLSVEILFAIPLSDESPGQVNIRALPKAYGGRSLDLPSDSLFSAFSIDDLRKPVSFITTVTNPDTTVVEIVPHISKFWDSAVEPDGGPTANNLPILRFADVLLTHAEIVNELSNGPNSEALYVINLVRTRAGLSGVGSMSQEDFRQAILDERRNELAWEGHRWFDLRRFDVLVEAVTLAKPTASVGPQHNLLPIPSVEIAKNPLLIQNPGY